MFRLKFLDLTRFFDRIYCIERPARTLGDTHRIRSFWSGFPTAKIHELSHHQRKPNPEVLTEMFADYSLTARDCAYVGDSVAKDVYMARKADCFAIWARYGTEHSQTDYEKLVRVSHWTAEEVAREADLRKVAENAKPDCIAWNTFAEVLTCLRSHSAATAEL
jgi:phosphoglycolate phosphatase